MTITATAFTFWASERDYFIPPPGPHSCVNKQCRSLLQYNRSRTCTEQLLRCSTMALSLPSPSRRRMFGEQSLNQPPASPQPTAHNAVQLVKSGSAKQLAAPSFKDLSPRSRSKGMVGYNSNGYDEKLLRERLTGRNPANRSSKLRLRSGMKAEMRTKTSRSTTECFRRRARMIPWTRWACLDGSASHGIWLCDGSSECRLPQRSGCVIQQDGRFAVLNPDEPRQPMLRTTLIPAYTFQKRRQGGRSASRPVDLRPSPASKRAAPVQRRTRPSTVDPAYGYDPRAHGYARASIKRGRGVYGCRDCVRGI